MRPARLLSWAFLLNNPRHIVAGLAWLLTMPLLLPLAARALIPRRVRSVAWGWITGGFSRAILRLIASLR